VSHAEYLRTVLGIAALNCSGTVLKALHIISSANFESASAFGDLRVIANAPKKIIAIAIINKPVFKW
jgi:hypothetical protein